MSEMDKNTWADWRTSVARAGRLKKGGLHTKNLRNINQSDC